jgi:hypothetical protein
MSRGPLAIDTVPLPERPIRISIPATVAFDIDRFHKAVVNIGERLGCKGCVSGADCLFTFQRNYVINPQTLAAEAVQGGVIIEG